MRLPAPPHISLAVLPSLLLLAPHVTAQVHQHVLNIRPHTPIHLRNAILDDAAAIANITIAAFFDFPDWDYLYQFRREYPEEHQRCGAGAISKYLALPLARGEVAEIEEHGEKTVIGSALWLQHQSTSATASGEKVPTRIHALFGEIANCAHRDLNWTRAVVWEPQWNRLMEKNLKAFGEDQLYLELLGTHPAYQGRGAGSSLVQSGLDKARTEFEDGKGDLNVTLIAQPTAETFYLGMGFKEVRNVTMKGLDGQSFSFNVMAYDKQTET